MVIKRITIKRMKRRTNVAFVTQILFEVVTSRIKDIQSIRSRIGITNISWNRKLCISLRKWPTLKMADKARLLSLY